MTIAMRTGGAPKAPMLLLLHGLGANSLVWSELEAQVERGWQWVSPDLPGHGSSTPMPKYSIGGLASAVAQRVFPLAADRPIAVLGHSLGGAVGLALASGWFGLAPSAVCGLGIKVRWSQAELDKARQVAQRPPQSFPTRSEAARRGLRLAGLSEQAAEDAPVAVAGVRQIENGWRPALDTAAFAVGAPDMTGLLAAARSKVFLAAGENDAMGPVEQLRDFASAPTMLPGLGHNAHVEDPAATARLVEQLRDAD